MKIKKLACYALLLIAFASCAAPIDKKTADTATTNSPSEVKTAGDANEELINQVYSRFVFATESAANVSPETYFTANALKRLQEDYEFDCEEGACYAFYALKTEMQDSNPQSNGSSQIYGIEHDSDGWFTVSYSDMGWPGKTRIRILDGKIDDYQRINQ